MNYLAQMLRDCNKNRSSSFTEISFPIIQEIENKIKNKNINLRKKMKQRLVDKLKLSKVEEKKQQPSALAKKDSLSQKNEKEIINYIEAYDDQKIQPIKPYLFTHDVKLEQAETQNTFLIYQLMRKRKPIFKIEEVRRKMKNKQNTKRMSFKECQCCDKIGRHKCPHTLCEGNCEKLRRSQKMAIEQFGEDRQALELAQQIIDQKARQENPTLNVVCVVKKEQEPLTIPKIDITEKQDQIKEEEGMFSERGRISENQSKSQISQSRRNKSNLNKLKQAEQQQNSVRKQQQLKQAQVKDQFFDADQQPIKRIQIQAKQEQNQQIQVEQNYAQAEDKAKINEQSLNNENNKRQKPQKQQQIHHKELSFLEGLLQQLQAVNYPQDQN